MMAGYPISSAPLNTVVITDQGVAILADRNESLQIWDSGWYLCDAFGNIIHCKDEGIKVSHPESAPRFWNHFVAPDGVKES
jgi:hypothetical protein